MAYGHAPSWRRSPPQLTKGAALDRESEKAEPNLRWRGIPGVRVRGDLTSVESVVPLQIGHSRALGLGGR